METGLAAGALTSVTVDVRRDRPVGSRAPALPHRRVPPRTLVAGVPARVILRVWLRGSLHMFRADDTRSTTRKASALLKQSLMLIRLPLPVARFYLSALRTARAHGDRWSLDVVTRPRELTTLLRVARGRRRVVEVGTATAWTTIAFALADEDRHVISFDVEEREHRDDYLALAPASVRARIELHTRSGDDPPPSIGDIDLLFLDGAHDEASTVAAYTAWLPRLAAGALVLFHDYGDPAYPGVEAAVRSLGLVGSPHGRLFVARAPVEA